MLFGDPEFHELDNQTQLAIINATKNAEDEMFGTPSKALDTICIVIFLLFVGFIPLWALHYVLFNASILWFAVFESIIIYSTYRTWWKRFKIWIKKK